MVAVFRFSGASKIKHKIKSHPHSVGRGGVSDDPHSREEVLAERLYLAND